MSDYRMKAWNFVDEDGSPLLEVDCDVTAAEAQQLRGKFACVSLSLRRAITREEIDAALYREFGE